MKRYSLRYMGVSNGLGYDTYAILLLDGVAVGRLDPDPQTAPKDAPMLELDRVWARSEWIVRTLNEELDFNEAFDIDWSGIPDEEF